MKSIGETIKVTLASSAQVEAIITSEWLGTMRVGHGSKVHKTYAVTATVTTEGRDQGREVNVAEGVYCSTYRSGAGYSANHGLRYTGEITCTKCNPNQITRAEIDAYWQRAEEIAAIARRAR